MFITFLLHNNMEKTNILLVITGNHFHSQKKQAQCILPAESTLQTQTYTLYCVA